MPISNELAYFLALRQIASYDDPELILKHAEKRYGLSGEEALQYAYENVLNEARNAVRGKRKPKEAGNHAG